REHAVDEMQVGQQRLKSLVNILQYPAETTQRFLDYALNEAIKLTDSKIGYIYRYSEETRQFNLNSWSKDVMEECTVADPQTCYELDKTGIWGEVVRQGKTILLNDFQADHPLKKGYPAGHAPLTRFLSLPVYSDNHIVAVVGVANKETDYGESDVNQLTLLMDVVWRTTERKSAIEELRVSEENYRLLFDQAADGIFISDQSGDLMDVNESGCQMSGYAREELLQCYREIITGKEGEKDRLPQTTERLKSGKGFIAEKKLIKKNGEILEVEIRARLLPDGRIQKVVRDITAHKKAEVTTKQAHAELQAMLQTSNNSRKALLSVIEDQKLVEDALRESEEKYRNLFENITQGFALLEIILDETATPVDYRFLAANPAFEKLRGLKTESIIGKTLNEVFPDSRTDHFKSIALTGEAQRYEDYTETSGKYFDVTAFRPREGLLAVVMSDITKRKNAESEINKLNLELEDRVTHRTAQLESANQELEAFSYSVSHDLRAPLRSINGFSQIIIDEYSKNLDPGLIRYLDLIRNNSNIMGQLVDDLLNFSRLGRQALTKVKVQPASIVRDVIESMQREISNRKTKFKVNSLPGCEADPVFLKQVYINLISNAVKFTRNQAEPLIEIGFTRASPPVNENDVQKDQPCYYVRDNGVGFDMKFYGKLFKVFQRLHRSEEYEGTGVGLAIVDRVIAKHGGHAWAESALGMGSTFFFTLGEDSNE
ncbi:MAG: Multi-sensor signal transduction histidine kinase, partial [Chloroflexi bacterium]